MDYNYIKGMLLNGFIRFYGEGYIKWSKENVQKSLKPRSASYELDDPEIQKILKELEEEGHIKLYYEDARYLEVLEPKVHDRNRFARHGKKV